MKGFSSWNRQWRWSLLRLFAPGAVLGSSFQPRRARNGGGRAVVRTWQDFRNPDDFKGKASRGVG